MIHCMIAIGKGIQIPPHCSIFDFLLMFIGLQFIISPTNGISQTSERENGFPILIPIYQGNQQQVTSINILLEQENIARDPDSL